MNKIISLIKVDLNTTYGLSALKYKFKNKKDRWQYILIALALLSLIPTYIMIVKGLFKLYEAYETIGQKPMFLLNGFIVSQFMIFLFGILFVMSKYYFSNDLNVLVPLPLKSKDIVGAKFVTLMINEYLTSFPIILPFIFIYGIKGGEGIFYWMYSLLLILFIPVIPLALASIIIILFMKYTNIKGRKDLIRIIGYFILLIVILGFQFKIQSITQNVLLQGEDFFLQIAQDSNLLVKKLGLSFPPSMWGALSLSNYTNITGFLNLILFIGVSIVVYLLMIEISERLFFEGLIGNMEVSTSKGKNSRKIELKEISNVNFPFIAIGLKEIKMLLRTPVYLLNSVGSVVIFPIILIISTFMDGGQSINSLNMITTDNSQLISLFGIGMVTILGVMNCVGCTTFSREGKSFWIQRIIPIKARDQILGRVISSLFVQIIGIIALMVSLFFITNITMENIFWIIFLGLLGSVPMTKLGMIVDISRPLLDWDNPQKVMKQNLNVLIAMGIGGLYLLLIGFLVYKLVVMDMDILIIYGVIGFIFLLSAYVFYIFLKKLVERQFKTLE